MQKWNTRFQKDTAYKQPSRVFALQDMTKPFHGWGHQQLEAFLGTEVTATVTAFVTVTMAATLTGKQKGQVIGANIGGVIALACIVGGIYLICTHRKRGRKGLHARLWKWE